MGAVGSVRVRTAEYEQRREENLARRSEFENFGFGSVFARDTLVDFLPIVLIVDVVPCFLRYSPIPSTRIEFPFRSVQNLQQRHQCSPENILAHRYLPETTNNTPQSISIPPNHPQYSTSTYSIPHLVLRNLRQRPRGSSFRGVLARSGP